jgi:hypothetical protein
MFTCHYRRALAWLQDCRGTNLVEAAFVVPLLLLLTFGILDFGGMFYAYLALESGVTQAARFSVTGQTLNDPSHPGTQLSRADSIKLAMRQATPTLTIEDNDFSFSHLPVGSSTWVTGTGGPNEIERVQINYDWRLMTPLIARFFPGGQLTLTVSSSMKNEPRFN